MTFADVSDDTPELDLDPGYPAHEVVVQDGRVVPFTVTDLASAEWAVRKLAKLRARFAESRAFYDVEKDRLDGWLEGEKHTLDGAEEFFGGLLEAWHRELLEDDDRRKTIKLPSGELKARKLPDVWTVVAEHFVPWAQASAPELVRTKVEPDKAALKKVAKLDPDTGYVLIDGEIVLGVSVDEGGVRFTVDTPEPVKPSFDDSDPF